MSYGMYSRVMIAVFIAVLIFTIVAQAQERRRVQPAFPIGAGEKMLVISGAAIQGVTGSTAHRYGTTTADTTFIYEIRLPVGTTLKRLLGDFLDQNVVAGKDMVISLVRYSNADAQTMVTLRSFDTSGIASLGPLDYKQVVSNPLSHSMLQGWTYAILVDFPTSSALDLSVSVVKLIYEP